eukprot:jgi/Chlat1/1272/Chrsp117S01699
MVAKEQGGGGAIVRSGKEEEEDNAQQVGGVGALHLSLTLASSFAASIVKSFNGGLIRALRVVVLGKGLIRLKRPLWQVSRSVKRRSGGPKTQCRWERQGCRWVHLW